MSTRPKSDTRHKILLTDDSKTFQGIFAASLPKAQFELFVCNSGQAALDLIVAQEIDFICSAYHLSDMEGIELCRRLRKLPQFSAKPFVLLTSEDSPQTLAKALPAGVTEIFQKSAVEQLLAFIKRFPSYHEMLQGRILYVEDNRSQREILKAMLEHRGLEVDAYATATEALNSFANNNYDLVLTDIVLDGSVSGLAFVNNIRRQASVKGDVPILAVTAFDERTRRIELFNLGVSDYIIKPVIEEELFVRIGSLLAMRRAANEERLHAIFAASPDPLLISDSRGLITMANRRIENLVGYSPDEIVGQPVEILLPERYRGAHPALRAGFARSSSARRMGAGRAITVRRKDGSEREVEISLSTIETAQGNVFACALRDVTQHRDAEIELRIAAAAFESQEGMVITDARNVIIKLNRSFSEITGYAPEEAVGRPMNILKSGRHDREFYARMWDKIVRDGNWAGEIWNRHKGGDIHPHWLTITAIRNSDGADTNYVGTYTDMTERVQAENRIREILAEQQLIFDNAQVGIIMAQNRLIRKCNQRVAEMLGFASAADLEGKSTRILYCSEEQFAAAGRDGYAQLAKNGYARLETEMLRQDGRRIWTIQTGHSVNSSAALEAVSIWVYTDITERKRDEQRIAELAELNTKIVSSSPIGILVYHAATGECVMANDASAAMVGTSVEQMLGQNYLELNSWKTSGLLRAAQRTLLEGGDVHNQYYVHTTFGKIVWLEGIFSTLMIHGERHLLLMVEDITDRKAAESELRLAAVAFESQEGLVVTDPQGTILRVNKAFVRATGYSAEEALGQNPRLLKSGRHNEEFYREMWTAIANTGAWQGEIWDKRKDGSEYPKWLSISAVRDDNGVVTNYIGTQLDLTERKLAEEKISSLAFYDQLTGLPNRTLLLDRLKQTMAASSRSGAYCALVFIDLDNFKTLNDTLGHGVGDTLLKQAAQRLIKCLREGDTVARLGGDEFVIVLAGLSTNQGEAAASAETVAEKILASLSERYQLENRPYSSTASLGVALFKGDALAIDELMKQADLAMYKAKESGRNSIRFFDPTLESAVKERAAMERDLQRALEASQFLLHYQAQVAGKGELTGAEALVRWQHPERGLVSPADFIPLAEETGLILPLGYWVLRTVCAQLSSWADNPQMAHLTVSVNVSARQFHQADFVDQVLAVLEITGANPQRLKLELTESLLVANVEQIVNKMFALKAVGIAFSLDDFGTGYSSLAYLKRLPLDQLKIDQSFVRDLLTDPNDAAIAKTIVALGQSLGLAVIAEGVEDQAQRDLLAESGCHAYQGYFFGRPVPINGFEVLAQQVQASADKLHRQDP